MYLLDRMGRAARRPTDLVVVKDGRLPWRDLHERALEAAGGLQGKGIGPGSTVAVLAGTSVETVIAVRAVMLAGAAVHMVQHPPRSDSFGEHGIAERLDRIGCAAVVVGPPFDRVPGIRLADLAGPYIPPDLSDDDIAVVQCTSGSTGPPQLARVSHASLAANIDAIQVAADRYFGSDVLCSWLPLHHDMGLIGFLMLPMVTGASLVLQPTADFVRRPRSWMETISAYGASATGAPNFAYAAVSGQLDRGPRLALGQLSFALCGGERIRPEDVEAFTAAAGRHGMPRTAFVAAYGMAESTLASTLNMHGLVTDRGRTVVGKPVPGLEVRITEAGEIQLKGSSIARVDPSRITDGWLATGDLGYLCSSGLVVRGRLKDLIIVAGRNIYPEDVESALADVAGLRPGNAVAVPHPRHGTEGIAVIAETRPGAAVDESLVADRVYDAIGIRPSGVRLLEAGQLPKTSSGKHRRREAARRFLTGDRVEAP